MAGGNRERSQDPTPLPPRPSDSIIRGKAIENVETVHFVSARTAQLICNKSKMYSESKMHIVYFSAVIKLLYFPIGMYGVARCRAPQGSLAQNPAMFH